jgi:hypothetical protein
VVHGDDEPMPVLGHAHQLRAQRHLGVEHEGPAQEGVDHGVHVSRGHVVDGLDRHRPRCEDPGHRPRSIVVHERAQRFVPGRQAGERRVQRGPVERAHQLDDGGHGVHRTVGVELVEHPLPLLGHGERVLAAIGSHRDDRHRRALPLDVAHEGTERRMIEQRTAGNVPCARLTDPPRDNRGRDRITAEGEEVVVLGEVLQVHDVGPGASDEVDLGWRTHAGLRRRRAHGRCGARARRRWWTAR